MQKGKKNHMSSINSLYVNLPLSNNVKYLQCYNNKGRSNRRQKIMWEQRECIKRNLHVFKGKKKARFKFSFALTLASRH